MNLGIGIGLTYQGGVFTDEVYIDAGATVQEIGLADPWPLA